VDVEGHERLRIFLVKKPRGRPKTEKVRKREKQINRVRKVREKQRSGIKPSFVLLCEAKEKKMAQA